MSGILLTIVLLSAPLADTRPPVTDALRLPEYPYLREQFQLAAECWDDYRRLADTLWELQPASPAWQQAVAARHEAEQLMNWYNLACCARDSGYQTDYRRDWLAQLRALSPEVYYSGRWPPPVPWWRLPRHRLPR